MGKKYKVELTEEQMRVIQNYVETMMRIEIGQVDMLAERLAEYNVDFSQYNPDHERIFDRYITERDAISEVLKAAVRIAFSSWGVPEKKDDDTLIAECIWDSIKFARGLSSWGAVLPIGKEPVPKIEVIEDGE